MKIIGPDMFRRAREGKITVREVKTFLLLDNVSDDATAGINKEYVLGWWTYCLADQEPDRSDPDSQPYRQSLFRYSIAREDIVPVMARYLDSFQPPMS
jgi:hypothetical protein